MYITALDIGTSQIKVLIAEIKKDGRLFLLKSFKEISSGIRKGEIVDINEAIEALKSVFGRIAAFDKNALKNIFVNVGGANVKCHNSKGIVAVSRADNEISQDDIDRVIKASQAIKLSPNRMIIHTLTKEFVVDGVEDVREPLGMAGTRLEINSLVIDAFSHNVKNILKIIESLGGKVGGMVYNPLASSRAVLTKIQKDLGVVLIDIGAGTTSMSVYEEGKLTHAASFPAGSANITNDLAIGLRCSVKAAELIKIFFGCALAGKTSSKDKITPAVIKEKSGINIEAVDKNFKSAVSCREVAEIIESRLTEIFEFVNNELKLIGRAGQLPAGAVICGAGAKMPYLAELAKSELKLSAEIGFPDIHETEIIGSESKDEISDPGFAAAVGLFLFGKDQWLKNSEWQIIGDKFSFIKNILKHFAP